MNAVERHGRNVWFQDVIEQIWIWTLWAFSVDRLLTLTSPLPHLLFPGTLPPPTPHPILYFWLLYNMGLIRSHWNDLRTPNIFCGGMPPDPHKWLTTDAFLPTQEFPPHKLHFWKKALWANRTDAQPSIFLLLNIRRIDLHPLYSWILWKCLFLVYQVSSTWCPAWLNWVLG